MCPKEFWMYSFASGMSNRYGPIYITVQTEGFKQKIFAWHLTQATWVFVSVHAWDLLWNWEKSPSVQDDVALMTWHIIELAISIMGFHEYGNTIISKRISTTCARHDSLMTLTSENNQHEIKKHGDKRCWIMPGSQIRELFIEQLTLASQ